MTAATGMTISTTGTIFGEGAGVATFGEGAGVVIRGEEATDETGVGVAGIAVDLEGDLAGDRVRVNSIESRCWCVDRVGDSCICAYSNTLDAMMQRKK